MAHPQADLPIIHSLDGFLDWQRGQDRRFELVDGRLRVLAGGSRAHHDIQINLIGELRNRLRGGDCRVNGPDLLVRTGKQRGRFSDASSTCEDEPDRFVQGPQGLFEILSIDSKARDRGEKWLVYQAMPSLRHYVLISQDRLRVEHFRRVDTGGWHYLDLAGADALLRLDPPGIELGVGDLYEGVGLDGPEDR